jgi:hypothetical protein
MYGNGMLAIFRTLNHAISNLNQTPGPASYHIRSIALFAPQPIAVYPSTYNRSYPAYVQAGVQRELYGGNPSSRVRTGGALEMHAYIDGC